MTVDTYFILEPDVEVSIPVGPIGPSTMDVEVSIEEGSIGLTGPEGPIGLTGNTGPPGLPGTSGGAYTHEQGVATNIWTVTHNLGFYPNVTVIDSAGSVIEGDVTYLSMNDLTIWFAASFSGRATLT